MPTNPGTRPRRSAKAKAAAASRTDTANAPRYDLRILESIRRIMRSVEIYSKQLATESGITSPQLICLLALVERGPMTTTALSRAIHLSASTVIGILDRLEERQLVSRIRDTEDRRVVTVSATATGRTLADAAPSPLQRTLADALAAQPEAEQAAIALALERVVALMEVQHLDAAPILVTGPLGPP